MLTPDQIAAAAARLVAAERTRVQTGLLSLAYPEMSMDDAYAVQAAFVAVRHAAGRRTIGWKIGLTSKASNMRLASRHRIQMCLWMTWRLRMAQPFPQTPSFS